MPTLLQYISQWPVCAPLLHGKKYIIATGSHTTPTARLDVPQLWGRTITTNKQVPMCTDATWGAYMLICSIGRYYLPGSPAPYRAKTHAILHGKPLCGAPVKFDKVLYTCTETHRERDPECKTCLRKLNTEQQFTEYAPGSVEATGYADLAGLVQEWRNRTEPDRLAFGLAADQLQRAIPEWTTITFDPSSCPDPKRDVIFESQNTLQILRPFGRRCYPFEKGKRWRYMAPNDYPPV